MEGTTERKNMLQIKNDFYIDSDKYNFILHQIKEPDRSDAALSRLKSLGREPKSESVDVIIGYYTTLQNALYGYPRSATMQAIAGKDMDLTEVKALLEALHEEIARVNA